MERQYKDSGIEWIGRIPENWQYKRFKYSGIFEKGKLPESSNIDNNGLPIIGASEMLGKDARTYTIDESVPQCKKDDILILWDGANAGITATGLEGVVSSTAVKYNCTDNSVLSKYAAYILKYAEHYFKEKVTGTTIPHMNMAYINDFPLLFPPMNEQQRIANYLDEKCGEIDSLIGLQEQMIEKLKAYKQSVITEAVTKGLNPNAKLVPSGIDWIDEIPEGWLVGRFYFLNWIRARLGWRGLKADEYTETGYPFLSAFNIINYKLDWSEINFINQERYDESPEIKLNVGDVLLVKDGAGIGKCARVDSLPYGPSTVNGSIAVITPCKDLWYKFLYYYLQSNPFWNIINLLLVGMGVPHLTQYNMKNIYLPLPPLSEQQSIASYLDGKCSEIDSLIALKQQKIEKLKAYKKSVIYEAVTGKTNVSDN